MINRFLVQLSLSSRHCSTLRVVPSVRKSHHSGNCKLSRFPYQQKNDRRRVIHLPSLKTMQFLSHANPTGMDFVDPSITKDHHQGINGRHSVSISALSPRIFNPDPMYRLVAPLSVFLVFVHASVPFAPPTPCNCQCKRSEIFSKLLPL